MQKLILHLSKLFNSYNSIEDVKQSIGFLELYLNDIHDIDSYIQWAHNPKELFLGTKSTWLEKKDGYILIGSLYTDPKAKLQYFKIAIPEFVKLLTEWETLVKEKRQKITITQLDDGTMTIVGENAKNNTGI